MTDPPRHPALCLPRLTEEDIKEADFAAYLASDSDKEEGEEGGSEDEGRHGEDAEALRHRYR